MLSTVKRRCPYCGERIELVLDNSAGGSQYVEDCQVCCRPITVVVQDNGEDAADAEVRLYREDD